MKKSTTIIIAVLVAASVFSGCSKGGNTAKNSTSQTASTAVSSSADNTSTSKDSGKLNITAKDVKSMDDSKLIESATGSDSAINLNDADNEQDLQGVDDILNGSDPMSDIPSK